MSELFTTPAGIALFVVGLLITIFSLTYAVLVIVLGRLKSKLTTRTERHFAGRRLLSRPQMANLMGLRSEGMSQVRGVGLLALSDDELYFRRGVPDREYVVPIDRISGVSTPTSFLGKSKFRKLLCVHFEGEAGPDELCLYVQDLDGWRQRIAQARG